MARFRNKKKVKFVRPPVAKKQQQQTVDHVTGDKIPRSFVFSRSKLPGSLRQLQSDMRKLMLPFTALSLREKKRNNLRDFLNVAGPMGVTHFLMLSKTGTSPYLRVARTPQGPTLTFKINEYSLVADITQSQVRPRCPKDLFKNPPLIVLSGFGTGEQHLKLTTIMFQNIFPAIDINTVKLSSCQRIVLLNYNKETKLIDFRHYSIRLQPVGVSRRIRKFVQNHQVPNLSTLQDVSDFVTKYAFISLDFREIVPDDINIPVLLHISGKKKNQEKVGKINKIFPAIEVFLNRLLICSVISESLGAWSSSKLFSHYICSSRFFSCDITCTEENYTLGLIIAR